MKKILFGLVVICMMYIVSSASVWAIVVKPIVEIDHPVVMADKEVTVYVLVQFRVEKLKEDPSKPRPNLNLALVIDRSGSMESKGKLDYARRASHILVDSMKPSDQIAVVEYDDQITLLWPSSPVESPEIIKRLIDTLIPRGRTNLTGGMMKGVDEVLGNLDKEYLNRVLLLSDGLANEGVTDPSEIKRLVREARRRGVHISTMGLGADYDEDLMQAIAQNAGGNYYFIETPTQMSRIFQQEMSILFTTVAKEVVVRFLVGGSVKEVDVFGFAFEVSGNEVDVEQEDFYSGETRSLLLRLELEPQKEGNVDLGEFIMTYMDAADKKRKEIRKSLTVAATTDPSEVAKEENTKVVIEATLIEADKKHEDSVHLYEEGKKLEAMKNIENLANELSDKNTTLSDMQITKKIEALKMETEEMNQADRSEQQRATYLKKSKERLYQSQRGKRGKSLLQEGDHGYDVEILQEALQSRGFYTGPIDGQFTPELTIAVREFQRQESLTVDGIAGPATLKALGIY